jgi:hypothetical protein
VTWRKSANFALTVTVRPKACAFSHQAVGQQEQHAPKPCLGAGVRIDQIDSYGHAPTLDAAKAAFKAEYTAWQACGDNDAQRHRRL